MVYLIQQPTVVWEPKDMDIYTPQDSWNGLIQDLKTLLGFQEDTESNSDFSYEDLNFPGLCNLKKLTRESKRFDILQTKCASADFAIPHFHSTALMNLLAWDHISIAYPLLTLQAQALIHPTYQLSRGVHASAMIKYESRGFQLQHPIQRHSPVAAGYTTQTFPCRLDICPLQERSFYDSQALLLPFTGDNISYPKRSTLWILGGEGCGEEGCEGQIEGWVEGDIETKEVIYQFCPIFSDKAT